MTSLYPDAGTLPPTGQGIVSEAQEIVAPFPKVTGGVLWAPLGSPIPTDSVTPLSSDYVSLGRVSDVGVIRNEDRPSTDQHDWGGDLIAILQQSYSMTIKFSLLQLMNADVQGAAHGHNNVTVTNATATSGTQIAVKYNSQLLDYGQWVIDAYFINMTMRLFIPYGRLTVIGPMTWVHKALAMAELTLRPFPDLNNNMAYEYWDDGVLATAAAGSGTSGT